MLSRSLTPNRERPPYATPADAQRDDGDVEDYFQVQALAGCVPRGSWDTIRPRVEANMETILELFEDAGHFPQLDDPLRFAGALESFLNETEPAELDTGTMRKLVLDRDPEVAAVLERLQTEHPAA